MRLQGKTLLITAAAQDIGRAGALACSHEGARVIAADPVQAEKNFTARQPMGRLATVDDIAPQVVYLLSDELRFVSGQAVLVDGGVTI